VPLIILVFESYESQLGNQATAERRLSLSTSDAIGKVKGENIAQNGIKISEIF